MASHNILCSLIPKFMSQHGAHLGPTGPRWVPCWPHELCYLGLFVSLLSHFWHSFFTHTFTYQPIIGLFKLMIYGGRSFTFCIFDTSYGVLSKLLVFSCRVCWTKLKPRYPMQDNNIRCHIGYLININLTELFPDPSGPSGRIHRLRRIRPEINNCIRYPAVLPWTLKCWIYSKKPKNISHYLKSRWLFI